MRDSGLVVGLISSQENPDDDFFVFLKRRPCTEGLFYTAHAETAAPFFVTTLKIRAYGNPMDPHLPLTGGWLTSGLATAEAQKKPRGNTAGLFLGD